ncbi:sulfate ABC transporter substrate-binding protein [Thalassospira marina]|uniref:Sulfate transporter subunit n=1 Tax=Thalassospira marina TaxID=2048283 RepID=A0A2N3KT33_9PROT|nr:sulfate ABC transporter substrate-binding protein [Thalassospira marina]AUG55883.1 sulfate transporter subunit [Thalassospira marina]PKR53724.1 sulfate transporter subunit [Thalassospira marina]
MLDSSIKSVRGGLLGVALFAVSTIVSVAPGNAADVTLLNVSYDPTRELYREFNKAFAEHWLTEKGQSVEIRMSHGGSGKQARSVIDGLEADIVTLALSADIDAIAENTGWINPGWRERLPLGAAPYTSTIVFLVRNGNPKNIRDWGDLVRDDVQVITPNPKTSGGARWNYLAAWAFAEDNFGGDEQKVREFIAKLYKNVPVLDTGARGSTNTFIKTGIGDVLLAWENEAFLALEKLGDEFEIVVPSESVLAQPPVSVVDKVVDDHGTRDIATAYLEYLYSPTGQKIAAKYYYRPVNPEDADPEDLKRFPPLKLFTVEDRFGGWTKAQKDHFADGGTFDQLYQSN